MPNVQVPNRKVARAALAAAAAALLSLSAVAATAQPQPPTRPGQGGPQIQPPRPGQGGPQIQPPRPGPGGPQIQPPRPGPGPRPPQPPPRPPTPPPAPGLGLTLYSGKNYTGRSRTFVVASANLAHSGFNDHARSAKIARHGRWLVCSDANYRGRCVVITRSTSDLNRLGLGRAVSSIRRQ